MRYLKTFENFDFDRIDSDESDYLYVETSQIPNSGRGLFTAIDIEKEYGENYWQHNSYRLS